MAFVQFEDLSGTCEVVLFPRTFKQAEMLLEGFTEFVIIGNLDHTHAQSCKIKANSIIPLEQLCDRDIITHAQLTLPAPISGERLNAIKELLTVQGPIQVHLKFFENNKPVILKSKIKTTLSNETIQTLRSWNVGLQLTLRTESRSMP